MRARVPGRYLRFAFPPGFPASRGGPTEMPAAWPLSVSFSLFLSSPFFLLFLLFLGLVAEHRFPRLVGFLSLAVCFVRAMFEGFPKVSLKRHQDGGGHIFLVDRQVDHLVDRPSRVTRKKG